jgi:hypothetical protein
MDQRTELTEFIPPDEVSYVEIAMVNFDQWILAIGIRFYSKENTNVLGMNHVVFENPEGFRVLDEGAMLSFPWKQL